MTIRFDVKKGIIWIQASAKKDAAQAQQALRLLVDEIGYTNAFILEESDSGTGFALVCCSTDTIKKMRENINYVKGLMKEEEPAGTDISAAIDDWNYNNPDDQMIAVKEETEQQTIENTNEVNAMTEQQNIKKVNVIFNDEPSDMLPLYFMYQDHTPQAAYITLDLRGGEIDADYSISTGSGVPVSVWNDVVIRFPVDPCLTCESVINVINEYKDELQAFYNESDTEIEFNGNEVGGPIDGDRETWQDKINLLKNNIESYSHNFAVLVATYETFDNAIELTPKTNNLGDYANSVLESIKDEFFVEAEFYDYDFVSRTIMELYANNTDCLNKNGMEMLLANIDDYSDQLCYDRDDIDPEEIIEAMERV